MPDVKISALPEATSIASTDVAPVVTGGVTKKASAATIVNAVLPAPGAIGETTPNSGAFTTLSAIDGSGVQNVSATNTNYTASGTGAVQRTVAAKLQESVSVKDFGAVGDGVANDTTAIQNAVNSGVPVYFPTGTYKITSAISLATNGIRLVGSNNTVILKAANISGINITGNECELVSVRVDGNGNNGVGIAIFGASNLLDACESYGNLSHGIMLDGQTTTCRYNRITNCYVHNNNGVGISETLLQIMSELTML